jgi:DNA repair exonuclease SbcCD nuclease subunit
MKIIVCADIHCGVHNKLDDCLWSMRTIRQYARENGIDVVMVAGDLFHDRVNLNIKVISDVADFLDETKYTYGQEWVMFPGNHDMFLRHTWDINSLRPMKRLMTLINDVALIKIGGRRFRIIPFIQNEDVYMSVLDYYDDKAEDGEVLLTHVGVSGATSNVCFLMQHWGAVRFDQTKFEKVFAGHFHCNQQIGKVLIPGSPLPFRFDEGMVSHGFYEYDIESGEAKFIDIKIGNRLIGGTPPPDFITILEPDAAGLDLSNCNVRIMLDTTKSRDELNDIRAKLESKGAIKISWIKAKEKELSSNAEAPVEPTSLFEKYLIYDKPKGLNEQLLIGLNKQILDESFSLKPELEEDHQ